jgi:hypothetical protein
VRAFIENCYSRSVPHLDRPAVIASFNNMNSGSSMPIADLTIDSVVFPMNKFHADLLVFDSPQRFTDKSAKNSKH